MPPSRETFAPCELDTLWLGEQFAGVTDTMPEVSPSQWAEEVRILPASSSQFPGHYSFELTPYLREIVDCFDRRSRIRYVDVMKGVQVGFTVGVAENVIGYCMAHERTQPMMMVTASDELAALRMKVAVIPMLHASGLLDRIRSSDDGNKRKSGKTAKHIEWIGGGFLIPQGANSPSGLRSISISRMLMDEVDAWKEAVGQDGDPIKLAEDRTNAFSMVRKVLSGSTPLLAATSKIRARFLLGDQRRYFVPCRSCGEMQFLRWKGITRETGEVWGMHWEEDDEGRLVAGSVRYICRHCGHHHVNDDKAWMLPRGEWRATATPVSEDRRSYHLPALLSPVGFFSWEECVQAWKEGWDTKHNCPRNVQKLQVFYNNVLGEPFEQQGSALTLETVSSHKIRDYRFGEVPNLHASETAGGAIQCLTAAVDVHGDHLNVAVFGWTPRRICYLIDYWVWKGAEHCTGNLDDPDTWKRLEDLVEHKVYVADDGTKYRLQLTLVDSGFRTDQVYEFCRQYECGIYPIKGIEMRGGASLKEFRPFQTTLGTKAVSICVDLYKDRWHAALRREWDRTSEQPEGRFNAPFNATDSQLKELTAEVLRERIDKTTGKSQGFQWHRRGANELWDLLVYSSAALDMMAWLESPEGPDGNRELNWPTFWNVCATGKFVEES